MELKILIKNTSYLVSTKIIKFLVGIVRAKIIAVLLGPLGAGIISQLTDITQKMAQFTLMSVNDGLVKQIAENKDSDDFQQKLPELLKTYTILIVPFTIISLVLLFIFSKEITVYIFGDIRYYVYYIIGLLTFPILIIKSVPFALLKGFKEIRYIAKSELVVIITNFLIFIPLVYFGRLTGAVIYVPLSFLMVLMVNNYFAKIKILRLFNIKLKHIFNSNVKREYIKELFLFAGIGLTSGIAILFSEIASRSIVVTQLGIEQLGLYSPITSWAGLFVGFIMPSLGTYLYPRFAEAESNSEIEGVLNDVLRLISFLMIPLLFIGIPIRYQIIPLFYSKEFIFAAQYLPWHFVGLLFYLWMYALALVLTPTGRVKTHGVIFIFISLFNFLIVYYFVPIYGLYGYMLKFIASPIFFFFLYLFYLKKVYRFSIEKKNLIIMIYVFVGAIFIIAFANFIDDNYIINFLIGFTFTIASIGLLSSSEKKNIYNKIKGFIRW